MIKERADWLRVVLIIEAIIVAIGALININSSSEYLGFMVGSPVIGIVNGILSLILVEGSLRRKIVYALVMMLVTPFIIFGAEMLIFGGDTLLERYR